MMIPPGASPLSPPPPAPPPPPSMAVPVVPKFDEPPRQRAVGSTQRRSFGDRITECLQEGAAAGLNANDRAAYSRACAHR